VISDTRVKAGRSRRRLPRDERARQLLDVAEEVFADRGVRASSMEDIAEHAGVTKPIVYDHFRSKDGLVAAVVLRAGAVLREAVLAAVTEAESPELAVADGLTAYFRFIEERRTSLHSLLTEGVVSGTEAAAALEQVRNQQAEMIATLLLQYSERSTSEQAQLYAQIVVGATERLATRPEGAAPGTTEPPSVEVLTRHVMDVIWCGFDNLRDGRRWSPGRAKRSSAGV
jgi:AcrR family transcriptional regulator